MSAGSGVTLKIGVDTRRAQRQIESMLDMRRYAASLQAHLRELLKIHRDATPVNQDPMSDSRGALKAGWFSDIQFSRGKSFRLIVGNRDPRSKWLLPILRAGSKPHTIRPKHAGVLAFYVDSEPVFAASVRHPGTKRVLSLGRDLDAKVNQVVTRIREAVREHSLAAAREAR